MADMLPSPRAGRASSVSSHGTTGSVVLSLQPRYVPRPEPQYISQSNAADLVTRQHLHDQFDFMPAATSPTNEGAIFSAPALNLLNTFLDALLYNFLGKAQSTSLNKLRPAIKEVLKAKLARDALAGADEELTGLYDESETEIDGENPLAAWHLEETFKLMRLRVMVFLGLGEFDDDDEERFLEEEEFHINGERASPDMSILNGPTAVYLASVLEYLAERLIDLSGEAAYLRQRRRMSTRPISESQELEDIHPERLVVEETDVEKIALNPTYGRLWRTWRKQHRGARSNPVTPTATSPRHARVPSEDGPFQSLKRIHGAGQSKDADGASPKELSLEEIPGAEDDLPEYILASNIPLPDDVDEIEDPSFPKGLKDADEDQHKDDDDDEGGRRARSALYFHDPFPGVVTPLLDEAGEGGPTPGFRKRSLSAPDLTLPTFIVPPKEAETVEEESEEADASKEEAKDDALPINKPDEKDGEHTDAEDTSEQTKEQDDGKDKEHQEAVAGVLTGAPAALTSSAITTVADSKSDDKDTPTHHTVPEITEHTKEDEPTMATPEEEFKEAETPLSHEAAVAHEMGVPLPKVADSEKDVPLTHEEAVAREMGVAPTKEAVKEEVPEQPAVQNETKAPAKVDNVNELPDLAAAETQAAETQATETQATSIPAVDATSESKGAPTDPDMPSHELAKTKQSASEANQKVQPMAAIQDGDEGEIDLETIGIAKTTNARIQSPSPTPEQNALFYGHVVGQDRRIDNFTRPSSRDKNAPFGGATIQRPAPDDEYNLAKPLQRNSAPSPLREVATASSAAAAVASTAMVSAEKAQDSFKHKQNVAQNRDKPVFGPPAGQHVTQQGTSTASSPLAPKKVSKENRIDERGTKVQPLQTDFQDPTIVRPPSSAHSSQTPHSARGSQSSIQPRALDKRPSDDVRQRNFDDLVKGEETVKYTLTPDNLRDDPYNPSVHRASSSSATVVSDRNGAISSTSNMSKRSPPRTNSPRPVTTAAAVQPPATSSTNTKVISRESEYRRSYTPLSQRPQPMNTNSRKSGLMPREPRVVTEQMRDFADWMRSTGPSTPQQATPLALAPSVISTNNPASSATANLAPKPRTLSRLQPRDPDTRGSTSSDLIDFIRQGPPRSTNGQHRIPRSVAPFRNTMDSDEFNEYSAGSSARQSANGATPTMPPTSSNGHTTTTASASTTQPTFSGQQTRPQQSTLQPPGGGPVRKQRRIKDPYAIDSDDDDEDTLTALPNGRSVRAEESLQDFLRNAEPPSQNAPQPLISAMPVNGTTVQPPSTGSTAAPRKKRFEARPAGATKDFQAQDFRAPTGELANFVRTSGPIDEGGVGKPAGLGKAGGGSKKGREKRGLFGLRSRGSVEG